MVLSVVIEYTFRFAMVKIIILLRFPVVHRERNEDPDEIERSLKYDSSTGVSDITTTSDTSSSGTTFPICIIYLFYLSFALHRYETSKVFRRKFPGNLGHFLYIRRLGKLNLIFCLIILMFIF
jgi:hypothetical protein